MQQFPSGPYQHQADRYQLQGDQPAGARGWLSSQTRLVVDQKAKLVELRNEYFVHDQHGNRIGSVVQVGQSALTRLVRLFTKLDSLLPVKLEIREADGSVALRLHKPGMSYTCTVSRPDGAELGRISMKIRIGKARLPLTDPAGNVLGEIRAENLRAWNFSVQDSRGQQVARVDKKWAGARELFTTADKYAVDLDPSLADPLRSLVIASCLAIDTLLKQQR